MFVSISRRGTKKTPVFKVYSEGGTTRKKGKKTERKNCNLGLKKDRDIVYLMLNGGR